MNTQWADFLQKILSAMFGIVGTWLAVHTFYEKRHRETLDRHGQAETKAYAAERDFDHLKNNQEQMKQSLKLLDDEISRNREDIKETKGMLIVSFGQSGDSGFFGQRGKG